MTKTGLIAVLSNVAKTDAEKILNAFIRIVENSLTNGEEVRLTGFGPFLTSTRNATTGRNPKTGETVEIPEKRVPKFKPGKQLKEAVGNKIS